MNFQNMLKIINNMQKTTIHSHDVHGLCLLNFRPWHAETPVVIGFATIATMSTVSSRAHIRVHTHTRTHAHACTHVRRLYRGHRGYRGTGALVLAFSVPRSHR